MHVGKGQLANTSVSNPDPGFSRSGSGSRVLKESPQNNFNFKTLPVYISDDFFRFENLIIINNFILIPGSVRKHLGSGFRFLTGSGYNEYGSETLANSTAVALYTHNLHKDQREEGLTSSVADPDPA